MRDGLGGCVAWQFSGQFQDGGLLERLVLWRYRRVRRIMIYLIFNLIFLLEEEEITQGYFPLVWPWGSFSYDDGDGQQERQRNKQQLYWTLDNHKCNTLFCPVICRTTWKGLIPGFMGGHLFLGKIELRVRSFEMIRIRISEPRSLGSW